MAGGLQRGTAAALLALFASSAALAQDRIGVTGAVNPAVTAEPPGQAERTLVIGTDVVYNERIATTTDGQAQFLFLDRSALTVGPNSDIVIDEFVYNPDAGAGHLVASATKGVFRFVGGALSKQDGGVAIKIGATTIGVRGGVVGFGIGPDGAVQVLKYFGDVVKVTTAQGTREIYRNDYYVSVDGRGAFGQSRPMPAPREIRLAITQPLNPIRGTSGGGKQQPTETTIRQSGYTHANSEDVAGSRADATSRQPVSDAAVLNPAELASLLDRRTVEQVSALSFQSTVVKASVTTAVVDRLDSTVVKASVTTAVVDRLDSTVVKASVSTAVVDRLVCVPRDPRDRHRHFVRFREFHDFHRHPGSGRR